MNAKCISLSVKSVSFQEKQDVLKADSEEQKNL